LYHVRWLTNIRRRDILLVLYDNEIKRLLSLKKLQYKINKKIKQAEIDEGPLDKGLVKVSRAESK